MIRRRSSKDLHYRITGLFVLALLLPSLLTNTVLASPQYSLSITPASGIMNLGSTPTLTFSVKTGGGGQSYSMTIGVFKPNSTGIALASGSFVTGSNGAGSSSFAYPSSSFTAQSGTIATDELGVYNVVANVTSPVSVTNAATLQFIVSSQLTVVISRPTGGSATRGTGVVVTATVSDLNSNPVTRAIVSANTPTGNNIGLIETVQGSGVYEAAYDIQISDPLGSWPLQVIARDALGNVGSSNRVSLNVTASTFVIEDFVSYNSKGSPSTDFSLGDTIIPFFHVRYGSSVSSTQYLTQGQYIVQIVSPSGRDVANLTAVYDYSRSGFYTPTGYAVNSADPTGGWTILILPNSITDAYQNTGPTFETSIKVQIHEGTIAFSTTAYWYYLVTGAACLLAGAIILRRLGVAKVGPEYLNQLMDGPIPRSSSILVMGDAGSGKTVLAYSMLHDELESGHQCALLSYDAFPESVRARMAEFRWNITPHLESGRLQIIDCYSGLTGDAEAQVKEPTDLTEVTIQVTGSINKAAGAPVTLFLDSLTPIFNGLESRQAVSFTQTLGAKVKKTGGVFVLLASIGAVPNDSIAKIKSTVDGVIELDIVRKGRKVVRYLSILKMERRHVSSDAVPFTVDHARGGLVFQVHRFTLWKHLLPSLSSLRESLATRLTRNGDADSHDLTGQKEHSDSHGSDVPSPDASPYGPSGPA